MADDAGMPEFLRFAEYSRKKPISKFTKADWRWAATEAARILGQVAPKAIDRALTRKRTPGRPKKQVRVNWLMAPHERPPMKRAPGRPRSAFKDYSVASIDEHLRWMMRVRVAGKRVYTNQTAAMRDLLNSIGMQGHYAASKLRTVRDWRKKQVEK